MNKGEGTKVAKIDMAENKGCSIGSLSEMNSLAHLVMKLLNSLPIEATSNCSTVTK
jgi:hypothetical protein